MAGAFKPSKLPGDRTRPEPHQPLTWLDFFVPTGFELVTLTSQSGLTTHSVTDCPTPRGQEEVDFKEKCVGNLSVV